jgi:hypothetical protein
MITTTLECYRISDRMPDDGILVLAFDSDGNADTVFFEGTTWRYADATPAPVPQFWAHFPAGPA